MNQYPLLYGQGYFELEQISPGQRLHPEAAQAFLTMCATAKRDGISLTAYSSFRSFHTQCVIWNDKWQGKRAILDSASQPLDITKLSDEQKLWAILRWSALPGTSRHHWGSDLDFFCPDLIQQAENFALVPATYLPGGSHFSAYQWVEEHALEFGFFFPYRDDLGATAPEPWHISYRPLSEQLQNKHQLHELTQVIQDAQIAGKTTILSHLADIYQHYFKQINYL
ncbi:M15 family metallopeptidase [Celerinatantimonas sp. MCCC 1A17872]|uniref:M15 family metallopeptidase n=1 Tax=Celerinatantimonas sp. MCCC 1A17872 TaxID=3177514 RepID=UPI0038C2A45B